MAELSSELKNDSRSEGATLEANGTRHISATRNGSANNSKSGVDIEGVFEIDGFEKSEERAFDVSDEDQSASDSGSESPPANVTRKHGIKHYASSLPMKVPLWTLNHEEKSDDEKVSSFEGPERIAESIKALAMSVRDGTEMFGDLPRRRLNTGDLVKSRPI